MTDFQKELQFLDKIKKPKAIVTGHFKFSVNSDLLMDLNLDDLNFKNCQFFGGDFCSSVWKNCVFERVLFRESSLIGTVFDECNFIACRFSNIELDFTIRNSVVKSLSATEESEEVALRPWE